MRSCKAGDSWAGFRGLAMGLLAVLLAGCAHISTRSWTFVQMCDPQLGFNGYADDMARFREAVKQINQLHPDFVVICGDLVNEPGARSYADFNAIKGGFQMPCYCAPGNHDVGNIASRGTLEHYRQLMGKDYFAFAHKGCRFIVLDSQLWKAPLPGETEKQEHWLEATLAQAARGQQPVFIVEHYPLFEQKPDERENYYNLPRERRQELLALFEKNGVAAVLAGHTHLTIVRDYDGIQMVTSQTTSRNFDKQPPGFRVWRVGAHGPYANQFVALKSASAEDASPSR